MRKKLLSLAISFLLISEIVPLSIPVGPALASEPGVTEFQVSGDTPAAALPAISGSKVVWTDYRTTNASIYVGDLLSGQEKRIPTSTAAQVSPAISGNRVVWVDYRNVGSGNSNTDIYMCNISGSPSSWAATQITTDTAGQISPAISGDKIVWCDGRNGSSDIYMYDLAENKEYPVSPKGGLAFKPAISGNYVVWQDYPNAIVDSSGKVTSLGKSQIVLCDISDPAHPLYGSTTGFYDHESPAVYSDKPGSGKIVWTDYRRATYDAISKTYHNTDICLCDIATGTEKLITSNAADQVSPAISGNNVVWFDQRDPELNSIYMCNIRDISMSPTASTPPEKRITADAGEYPSGDFKDFSGLAIDGENIAWNYSQSSGLSIRLASLDTLPPSKPSIYSTKLIDNFRVRNIWYSSEDTGTGVSSYEVWRRSDTSSWTKRNTVLASWGAPNPSSIDTLAKSEQGKTWYYAVKAIDPFGNPSGLSEAAQIYVPDTEPPTAPSRFAIARSGSSLNITWTAEDSVGVTGYEIWQTTNLSSPWTKLGNPTAASFTHTPSSANQRQYYKVMAFDKAGNKSPFSAIANGIVDTLPPTFSAAPKASPYNATAVSLTLTATDTGSGLANYTIQRSPDGKSNWTTIKDKVTGTSYIDATCKANTMYYYQLTAFDKQGNSAKSGVLGARTYTRINREENTPYLTWSGSWTASSTNSNYSGGVVRYTKTAGSYVQVTFRGGSVYWVGTRGPDRGKADVFLDGVKVGTFEQNSASAVYKQTIFQKGGLTDTAHTLKIVATGGKITDVDYFMIDGACPGVDVEETVSATWSPSSATWISESNSNHSGKTAKYSVTVNSFIERSFTGTYITWIGSKGKNQGIAKVFIDGALQGSIDTYAGSTVYQQPLYTKSGLGYGPHKLKIVVTGTKNASATDKRVYVDAFVIR